MLFENTRVESSIVIVTIEVLVGEIPSYAFFILYLWVLLEHSWTVLHTVQLFGPYPLIYNQISQNCTNAVPL